MRQVILDTNAVRYFYQIECCNGDSIVGHELEFLYCLETLCEDCHAMKHGK